MSALFVLAGLVLALATGGVLAGTTGKVVGKVTDAKTGEGLPGANVVIVGTRMGAATDLDGSYVIINVPVGTYTVSATMIGFRTVSATGVRSIQDLTSRQDFKLDMAVIGMKELIVPGVRPLIEKSATTTTRITTTKEIEAMPVARPQDVVAVTAGAVGSGNNINIRGGRRDEISYFVDGQSVNDAVVGGAGLNINKLAIQEVMVQTGGFSAEYGEALSGIVNIVTKEGSEKFSGILRATSDQFLGPVSNHFNLYEGSMGGAVPGLKNLKYYVSSELTLTDNNTPYFLKDKKIWERVPIKRNADGTVDRSQLQGGGRGDPSTPWVWADTIPNPFSKADSDSVASGGWDRVKGRRIEANAHDGWKQVDKNWYTPMDRESYRVQGKLSYAFTPNMKFSLGANVSRDQYMTFDNTWKYRLDQYAATLDRGFLGTATWRHQLGKKTFYTLAASRFETSRWVASLNPEREKTRGGDWWKNYEFMSDKDVNGDVVYDEYSGRSATSSTDDNPYGIRQIFVGGNSLYRVWSRRYEAYWGFKGDLTHQIGRVGGLHELRGGLEAKQYRVDRKYNSLPWDQNAFRDEYVKRQPVQADAYFLDKMEFEGLVVNAGARFDYLDPKAYKMADWFEQTTRTAGDTVKAKAKYKLSPRLGISHPVSDRTVLHFSYGQFFQTPQLQFLYESVSSNISYPNWIGRGNQILGDPDQSAQTTIQYETGFSQQLSADVAGDLTMYYKDIQGYSGTHLEIDPNNIGSTVTVYENVDYANVRGFEATIQKRPGGGILSGKLSYSLSVAKGSASNYRFTYDELYAGYPLTKTDNYLSFDQRHTFSNDLNFALPAAFGPKVGNNPVLGNVNLNFLTTMGSGMPFTPTDSKGQRTGNVNSARKPWSLNTDMRVTKELKVLGLGAQIAWEVTNLFNRKNVVDVYSYTGSPIDDGKTFPFNDAQFSEQKEYTYDDVRDPNHTRPIPNALYNKLRDTDHNGTVSREEAYKTYLDAYQDYSWDPTNYGAPRQMKLQFGIRW
jgi:outer membrane receptor protein involved in Fe transport